MIKTKKINENTNDKENEQVNYEKQIKDLEKDVIELVNIE